jgi:hypothetical protein
LFSGPKWLKFLLPFLGLGQLELHLLAVEAVHAVAFDDGGVHTLAAEDVLKGAG